jgi:hypothetical protein
MPSPTKTPATIKKKPVSRAKATVQTNGKASILWTAWNAWARGDRMLLLQIWDCYAKDPIPPDLHVILRRLIEHASIVTTVTKRKPGRPTLTTRLHNDAERARIVRNVEWLLKIKPGMTKGHARHLTAQWLNLNDRSESVKDWGRVENRIQHPVGQAYLLPPLSSGGALIALP